MKIKASPTVETPFVPDILGNHELPPEEQVVCYLTFQTDQEAQEQQAKRIRAAAKGRKGEKLLAKQVEQDNRDLIRRHVHRIERLGVEKPDGTTLEIKTGADLVEHLPYFPPAIGAAFEAQLAEAIGAYNPEDEGFLLGSRLPRGSD